MDAAQSELGAGPAVGRARQMVLWLALSVLLALAVAIPSASSAAVLLFGGAALALAIAQPAAICVLMVPAVAFGSLFERSVGPLRAGATDVLVGVIVLTWALRALWPTLAARKPLRVAAPREWLQRLGARWRVHPTSTALAGALVAYVGVILLSFVVASNRSLVAKEALKWSEVIVLFFYASAVLRTPRQRELLAWSMVAVGVLEALWGYVQWILATGSIGADGSTLRVFGTFDQPNPYAAYLNLALPFALALAVFHRRVEARWLAAGAATLLLVAQGLAASRGGLLALAAAVVVMVVAALRIEKIALIVGTVAGIVIAGAWALGVLPQRIQYTALHALRLDGVSLNGPLNDANFSSVERLAHWVAGGRMFLAHPILGVGAGNYGIAYPRFAAPGWPAPLGHAHNYFINAAAETGLIGAAVFVALVVTMFWVAWRGVTSCRALLDDGSDVTIPQPTAAPAFWVSARRSVEATWRGAAPDCALSLAVLGVIVAVTVQSLVDDVFVHAMELQIALCLGLAASMVLRRAAARMPDDE
ncbi:MAG TPA: O-antigen ligase family protein [Ktedonobacterales bacterium]